MTTFQVHDEPNGDARVHIGFNYALGYDPVLGVRADQREDLARRLSPHPYLTGPELLALLDGEALTDLHDLALALADAVRERLADRPVLPEPTSTDVRVESLREDDESVTASYVMATWRSSEGQDATGAARAVGVARRRAEAARQAAADQAERQRAEQERREAPGKALYEAWLQALPVVQPHHDKLPHQWPWWQLSDRQRAGWCDLAATPAATAPADPS